MWYTPDLNFTTTCAFSHTEGPCIAIISHHSVMAAAQENIYSFSHRTPHNALQQNQQQHLIFAKHTKPHSILTIIQGWVMGIISISQPSLEGLTNLPQITQLVSGRAGLLLQLLESQSMCYKPRETQQTLYNRAGSCWFLFRNQYYTSTSQEMLLFLYQFIFTLVYPV